MEKGEDEVNQGAILSPQVRGFFILWSEMKLIVRKNMRLENKADAFCELRTVGKRNRSNTVSSFQVSFKYYILSFVLLLFTIHSALGGSLFTPVYAGEIPKRIISLAPSMTEILYALRLEDNIVAVTSYCDYPEEAKKKPKIGGMSNPSLEAVVSLKPDIVVMTTDGNPKEFEERLRSLKIRTYIFKARRIRELPNGIRELGSALGIKERADKLAGEIETAIGKVTSLKSQVSSHKKKILFIVWPEPLIVAGRGTAIDDAINILGHENIAAKSNTTYPKYSIEEVLRKLPDVIFIGMSMGQENIQEISKGFLKKISMVPAVKNNNVFYVGDNLYRLGPRVINGIEEMKRCLK